MCLLFLVNQLFHPVSFTALVSDAPQKTEMCMLLFLMCIGYQK